MEKRKKSRGGKVILVLLAALIAFSGLGLLLYPTIANYVNSHQNRATVSAYREQVQALSGDEYAEILQSAKDYNAALANNSAFIAELTDEQREIYNSMLDVTGSGVMGYIEIKKADIYLAIYHGTSEEVLHAGVGHLEGSSLPVDGFSVHTVLSGHSGLPSAKLFTDIDQLEIGDIFTIYVLNEELTYQVEDIQVVLPEVLEKLPIEKGENLCSLVTCTPYGVNSHRLVVTGRRIETPQKTPGATELTPSPSAQENAESRNLLPILLLSAGIVIAAGCLIFFLCKRNRRGKKTRH